MKQSAEKMDEAYNILKELDLLRYLQKFGKAEVVGSVALDLIVKPDLDLHLLIDSDDLYPITSIIMKHFLDQTKINEVRLTDWRSEGGLKIGVDAYAMPLDHWSIDIWVTNEQGTTAFDYVRQLNDELTMKQRSIILKIKAFFYKQGLLRDGLSLRIYQGVINYDVNSVEEFMKAAEEGIV